MTPAEGLAGAIFLLARGKRWQPTPLCSDAAGVPAWPWAPGAAFFTVAAALHRVFQGDKGVLSDADRAAIVVVFDHLAAVCRRHKPGLLAWREKGADRYVAPAVVTLFELDADGWPPVDRVLRAALRELQATTAP